MGMLVRSSDAFQGIAFAVVLPLSFVAGTFVPISGMTTALRVFGEYDPLPAIVAALRQITAGTHSTGSWPLEHPVPAMMLYSVAIIAVCLPLALRGSARKTDSFTLPAAPDPKNSNSASRSNNAGTRDARAWESFAVMVGGASGALTGLLFVSVSLNRDQIVRNIALRSSAGQTLVLLIIPLVLCGRSGSK